jgi:rSAM/selenodomain-associated transferase 1
MKSCAETALLVFARLPQPGKVKTRLIPALGPGAAAVLSARMIDQAVRTAVAAGVGPIFLYGVPHADAAFFRGMRKRYGVRLRGQGRGDLGDRMYRALRRHRRAVLIGSDCPALKPEDLRTAACALDQVDVVLAPAEDGGYALIGTRRVSRAIFDGVAWGGARVLAQTRARLRRLGWRSRELRTVWDVDRPADVARLGRSRTLAPLVRSLGALSDIEKMGG